MHLEKATSHSSEAGLAGWISSNDVTLFTVVLVIVVAIFLQTNLIKRTRANTQLESENTSLTDRNRAVQEEVRRVNAQLAETNTQLATARSELEQTTAALEETRRNLEAARQDLAATQQERDRLNALRQELDGKLLAAMEDIKKLNASLDALNIEKANLMAAGEKLAQEKGDLTKEKESLTQAKTAVEVNLADLTTKLQQRLKELDDLQKERDLLDQQAKALSERVARLEAQLGDTEKNLTALKQTSESESADLKRLLAEALERYKSDQTASATQLQATTARATTAEAAAKEATTRADDYLDRLRRAAALFKDVDENKKLLQLQIEALKTQLANALDELKTSQQQTAEARAREATINRELVGLRGGLKRVAILFDSSGSMLQSGRWEEVQRIAGIWIDHLEVDECVLIVFSSGVATHPADGSLLRVSGPDGQAGRQQMSAFLKSVKPEGWTNTLAAMRKAYDYPGLDTIILFSDGAPTLENSGRFSAEAAQQVYALCRANPGIPVNAIGLGNYFDPEFSTFLRTVAQLTNGTFVGR